VTGGDKEEGEGIDGGMGEKEREAEETKEKETGIDSVPRYEARRNNMRRRTASTRSRIGVAGAVPSTLSPTVGHQWRLGVRQSHQPRWQRRVTTALGTVRL